MLKDSALHTCDNITRTCVLFTLQKTVTVSGGSLKIFKYANKLSCGSPSGYHKYLDFIPFRAPVNCNGNKVPIRNSDGHTVQATLQKSQYFACRVAKQITTERCLGTAVMSPRACTTS